MAHAPTTTSSAPTSRATSGSLVHWSAELTTPTATSCESLDHTDDLTVDRVIDQLVDTMATAGHHVDIPAHPLKDPAFITELATFYNIAPTTEWLEIPAA
ncbi:MAG: resuscitation-promoting factor Rpf1 domain-containing protein [Acidimicrobiales bacterium]